MRWKSAAVFVSLRAADAALFPPQAKDELGSSSEGAIQPHQHNHLVAIVLNRNEWHVLRLPEAQAAIFCLRKERRDRAELSVLVQCNDILFESALAIEPLQLPPNFPSTVAAFVELPANAYRTCEDAYYQALTDAMPLLAWALQHGERTGDEYSGVRELQDVSYRWSLYRDCLRIYIPSATGCRGGSRTATIRTVLGGESARCSISVGNRPGKAHRSFSVPLQDDIDGLFLQAVQFVLSASKSHHPVHKYAPNVVLPINTVEANNQMGMQKLVAARSHDATVIRFSALLTQAIEDLQKHSLLPRLSTTNGSGSKPLLELQSLYSAMNKAQRSHVADMFAVHHAGDKWAIWLQYWAMRQSMWTVSPTLDLSKWTGWTEVLFSLVDDVAVAFKEEDNKESAEQKEIELNHGSIPHFTETWGWCLDAMNITTPISVTPKNRKDLNSAAYWVLRFLLFALEGSNHNAITMAGLRVLPSLLLLWEQRQQEARRLVLVARAVSGLLVSTQSIQGLDQHRTLPTITQLIRRTERVHGDRDENNWSGDTVVLFDKLLLVFQIMWAAVIETTGYERDENLDKVCETMYRLKCSATARQPSSAKFQKQLRQIECRLYDCIGTWCADVLPSIRNGTRCLEGMQCFSLLQLGDLYIPTLMQAAAAEGLPPNYMEGVESYTQMLTKLAYVLPWPHRDLMTFRQKWVQPLVDILVWMMCASAQQPSLKIALIMTELLLALSLSPEGNTTAFLLAPELIEKLLYILTLYRDNSSLRTHPSRADDAPGSSMRVQSPESFAVGEHIDGLYKMKSLRERWFPGVVQNINPDGTMNILYDDGEVATNKPAHEVRKTKRRSMRGSRSSRDGQIPSPTPSNDRASNGEENTPPQMRKSALVANDMLQRSLKAMHKRSISHSILEIHSTAPSASLMTAPLAHAEVDSVAEREDHPEVLSARKKEDGEHQSDSGSDDAMVFSIPAKLNKSASLADLSSPIFSNKVRLPDSLRFIRSSTQCGSAHSLSSALVNTEPTPGPDGERDRRDSYFTRGSTSSQRLLFDTMMEGGNTIAGRARAVSMGRSGIPATTSRVWNTWDALSDYFRKKQPSTLERGPSLKSIDTATTSKLYSESSDNDDMTSQRQQLVVVAALVLLGVINADDGQYHINPQLTDDATFEMEGQRHSAGPILFALREFFSSRNGHDLCPVLFEFAQQRGKHFVSLLQLLGLGRADTWISNQVDGLMRIADGAFGSVFTLHANSDTKPRKRLHDDLKLAVKRIARENSPFDRPIVLEILGEVSCLKRLRGERHVCRLVDFFPVHSEFWIVLEHCDNSARFWRQKLGYTMKMNEQQLQCVLWIFAAMCAAVAKIHEHKIIHFDIKCDNVLLRGDPMSVIDQPEQLQNLVCICDFGESLIVESDKLSQEALTQRSRGTLCIQSPEMLSIARRDDHTPTIGQATDIWSLGCALYELMSGEYLFRNKEWTELFATLCSAHFELPQEELNQCKAMAAKIGMQEVVDTIFNQTLLQESSKRAPAAQLHAIIQQAQAQSQSQSLLPSRARPTHGSRAQARRLPDGQPQAQCVQILQDAAAEQSTAVVGGTISLRCDLLKVSFHPCASDAAEPTTISKLLLSMQDDMTSRSQSAPYHLVLCDTTHSPPSSTWPPHATVVNTHSSTSIQQSVKPLLKFLQGLGGVFSQPRQQHLAPRIHIQVVGDDDAPSSARTVPWQRPSARCSLHTQLLTWALVCAIQALEYVSADAESDLELAILLAWSDTRAAISTDAQLLSQAAAITDVAFVLLSNIELSECK